MEQRRRRRPTPQLAKATRRVEASHLVVGSRGVRVRDRVGDRERGRERYRVRDLDLDRVRVRATRLDPSRSVKAVRGWPKMDTAWFGASRRGDRPI
jgi:hypothetical protein